MSLPTIMMPKKVEPEPEPEPTPNEIHSEVDDDLPEVKSLGAKEVTNELVIEDVESSEDEDPFDEPPPPKPRAPQVKPVLTGGADVDEEPSNEFSDKSRPSVGKRKYVRKAPMSDKQKDHLAKIRKIASEKRLKEREAKALAKEEELIAKAEAKILKRKKKEEEAKAQLQDESDEEIIAPTQRKSKSHTTPLQQNSFTKEDMENAMLSAVSSYDQLRKKEKAEKKIQQQKNIEQEKMKRIIQTAIQPQLQQIDPWRVLFS